MAYTTINKPTDYFETVTYSGNGTGQDITTLDFQPDWLWIKRRDSVGSHRIQDSIRGTTNYLQSDKTDTEASGGDVDAFLSNGFSLSGGSTAYNVSGGTYVGWSWLGGGTASSNTDGSITSTVSANTTSGFSIVSYTGTGANATIGHGLGVAPKMIINKCRSAAQNWATYHSSLGGTKALFLDGTNGETTSSSYFNNTDPTSSVFSVGNSGDTNLSSGTHISYCFAEVKGFSKFGSYVGNGNANGTFVYTGFKPAFILYKNVAPVSENWEIHDTKRSESNISNKIFYANQNTAETTTDRIDILSNGFKSRTANSACNGSGNTIIYMAFAEEPLVGDNPATAR